MQNQNQSNHEHYPEEIDLVDLAAVMYRRKVTLVLVVLVSVVLATGYWFSLGEKLQVSAVFTIGEIAILEKEEAVMLPLMLASDSSQLLKLVYLPALIKSIKLETGTEVDQEDIEINYAVSKKDSEENTAILELFTEGSQQNAQALIPIFNDSLELLLKNHTEMMDEYRNTMNSLLETQKSKLLILNQLSTPETPNEGLAQRSLVEANILSLNNVLSASTHSKIIKSASAEPAESKGPVVYVAAGLVSGLFIGCFLVFFLELYAKAKVRATETANL